MNHKTEQYKGYTIQKRTDVKTHTCIIYKGEQLIKCIVGDILPDGTENSVDKAKLFIDKL